MFLFERCTAECNLDLVAGSGTAGTSKKVQIGFLDRYQSRSLAAEKATEAGESCSRRDDQDVDYRRRGNVRELADASAGICYLRKHPVDRVFGSRCVHMKPPNRDHRGRCQKKPVFNPEHCGVDQIRTHIASLSG